MSFCVDICHLYIFFGKVSLKIFVPIFKNWVDYFLIVEFLEFFIYSGYKFFVRYEVCKYLLLLFSFSFYYLIIVLEEKKFKFWWSSFYQFFFLLWIIFLVSCPRALSVTSDHKTFFLFLFFCKFYGIVLPLGP